MNTQEAPRWMIMMPAECPVCGAVLRIIDERGGFCSPCGAWTVPDVIDRLLAQLAAKDAEVARLANIERARNDEISLLSNAINSLTDEGNKLEAKLTAAEERAAQAEVKAALADWMRERITKPDQLGGIEMFRYRYDALTKEDA